MLGGMKTKNFRAWAIPAAMPLFVSLFVSWHTLAMLVAAAPDSRLTASARTLFDPYLLFFGLDSQWGFFAPDVPNGHDFRYAVETASGEQRLFRPSEEWNPLQPTFIWFRDRYKTVMQSFEDFAPAAVASICKQQAALNPVSVTLIDVTQKDFTPEDRLRGKSPLDPEFQEEEAMEPIRCPGK